MNFIYTKAFKRAFVAFVLISLLMVMDGLGYTTWFKNIFLITYSPIARTVGNSTSGIKEFIATFGAIKSLASENSNLNQKVDELSFENARLQSAKQENITLRRALKFYEESELTLIPAEVVLLDPTGFTQTLTIKFSDTSVRPGSSVVVYPGILIGTINKVFGDTAEVTLITDPSIVVNGEVADSGAKGLVKGEHGLGLTSDLITQNEVIKVGDRVITSGLSADFPRGLFIGEITGITSSSSELFQKASISPAANLKELKAVFILK